MEDSGPRIAPEVAREIFRAFFTTKKVGEGTGLGLSIARELAEVQHGRLTHEARDGGGSRFTLDLPAGTPPDN